MNHFFDTAILKYHRIEYGTQIETEVAKRPTKTGRTYAFALTAVIAVGLVTSLTA